MTKLFHAVVDVVAPPLSIRRQFLQLSGQAAEVFFRHGPGPVIAGTRQALARYRRTGALIIPVDAARREPVRPPYSYRQWIQDNEPSGQEPAELSRCAAALSYTPRISIIMPVYNPPIAVLDAAIAAVLAQVYPRWTLCIANGDGANRPLRDLLNRYAAQDARILVTHLETNRGISGNSNAALELATGEFVALMDHDDLIAPHLLLEVATCLNQDPDADIIYFDEDKLSADGLTREQPWFKPQFSPDLMLSTNLLMHAVFRRALIQQVGGFRLDADGAQDWDLALRCSLHTTAIRHIPQVLYHWRMIAGSAALDANAKPWASAAQAQAIVRHVAESDGTDIAVEFPAVGRVHIQWPAPAVKISIIIPNKDRLPLLRACLDSIFAQTSRANYEIIIVDTGSEDAQTWQYYAALRAERGLIVVEDRGRFNYSRANNRGVAAATGELLLFLNNDTEVLTPGWLQEMAGWSLRPGVGVVGAKLLRPSGLIQHAGIIIGLAGHGSHVFEDMPEDSYTIFGSTEWVRNCQAVTGACMMVRSELFEQLGGFDEVYRIGYSDIDLCLRARAAGRRVVYTPYARLLHHEGGSRGYYLPPSDVLRASCQMLPAVRQGDPFFNPNLASGERQPALARPNDPTAEQRIIDILRAYGLAPAAVVAAPVDAQGDTPSKDVGGAGRELAQPTPWPQAAAARRESSLEALSILLLSHDLSLSGAPLMLAQLAVELADCCAKLAVLSAKDGPLRALYEAAGIPVQVDASLGEPIDNVAAITRALGDFDLLLCNTIVSWPGVHAAAAFNKFSVLWLHESQYGYELAAAHPSVAEAIRSADLVVAPTHHLARLYREFLPEDRFAVVPNGLDVRHLQAAVHPAQPAAGQPAADSVRIVCIGSLEPRKGQDFLLAALRLLPKETLKCVTVDMLGRTIDPAFAAGLRQAAVPNVRFIGEADHAAAMAHLAGAHIFVLSSRDEVLPVTLLEAMAHGVAIIAANVGGVAEAIVHEHSGLIVEFGDTRALAGALQQLLADPALRGQLGHNAQTAFYARFTVDRFAGAMTDLLQQVVGSRQVVASKTSVHTAVLSAGNEPIQPAP